MGWVVTMLVGLEARNTVVDVRAVIAVHEVVLWKY